MTDSILNVTDSTLPQLIEAAQKLGLKHCAQVWKETYIDNHNAQNIHVVVMGEFNHGKSSLINALIGENILPSGMVPTTQIDTWIYLDAPESRVTAYRARQAIQTWSWPEWRKLSTKKISEFILSNAADRLEIAHTQPAFVPGCVFIDTPGLNEASLARESYLNRYFTHADLAIIVLDANQALTRTEQTVIRQWTQNLKPEQRMLIINKCDRLCPQEWLEICAYVEQTLACDMPHERFYMVSSKDEDVGDWQDLKQAITQRIEQLKIGNREAAQIRAIREISHILEACTILKDAFERQNLPFPPQSSAQIPLSPREIADIVSEISSEIQRNAHQTVAELERFKTDFLRAMPRELDKASLEDVEKWFEPFIDETFARFAKGLVRRQTDALSTLLETLFQKFQLGEISFAETVYPLHAIERLMAHPVSTGAFDSMRGLSIWQLPLPLFLPPMAERPRRENLKMMAQKAIEIRTSQYSEAFQAFHQHQNEIWCTLLCSDLYKI